MEDHRLFKQFRTRGGEPFRIEPVDVWSRKIESRRTARAMSDKLETGSTAWPNRLGGKRAAFVFPLVAVLGLALLTREAIQRQRVADKQAQDERLNQLPAPSYSIGELARMINCTNGSYSPTQHELACR